MDIHYQLATKNIHYQLATLKIFSASKYFNSSQCINAPSRILDCQCEIKICKCL